MSVADSNFAFAKFTGQVYNLDSGILNSEVTTPQAFLWVELRNQLGILLFRRLLSKPIVIGNLGLLKN